MCRLTKEFELKYQDRFDRSSYSERERMRTDWYWFQYLIFEDDKKPTQKELDDFELPKTNVVYKKENR